MSENIKANPTQDIQIATETTPVITSGQSNGANQPRTTPHHGRDWRRARNIELHARITQS